MMDFETWLLDYGYDRIFRMWKYKKMFTPYEQQKAFFDESRYEDTHAKLVKIKEVAELPDGDLWIGFVEVDEGVALYTTYAKLSEISLEYWPQDEDEV